jgi:hypothetical protein
MRRLLAAACLGAGAAVVLSAAGPAVAAPARQPARNRAATDLVKVHAGRTTLHANQSNNWSGYNVGSLSDGDKLFTSISGQWVVPTATQHTKGQAESSASWVGIGGGCVDATCALTDETLIQAGTEQDVSSSGAASYYAWYEIIPAPSIRVSLPVHAGNTVSVSIAQAEPEVWTITISDLTTKANWSTTVPYPSTMDTAEWIEETPLTVGTGGTGLSAMPTLGTVTFDKATLNGANPHFTAADEMQLVNSAGRPIATPSAPDPDTDGFNDCTWASSCSAPSSS